MSKYLPVLMYHHINPTEDMVTVSPENFESQLLALCADNYTFINTAELIELSQNTENNPKMTKKPLLLTFDDGFLDNWLFAFPLLKKHHIKATIFINPTRMLKTGIRDQGVDLLPHRQYARLRESSNQFITVEEMVIMQNSGLIDFQSHTLSHIRCDVASEETKREIIDCKAVIETLTNKPCEAFAWPYGDYNEKDLLNCQEVGYKAIFTTDSGIHQLSHSMNTIKRFNVKNRDGKYLSARLALHQMPIIGSFYNMIRGIFIFAFILGLSLSSTAKADIIYMKNNTLLFGIIEKDLGDKYLLSISKGDITVAKDKIKRIEYDYKARFALLDDNDLDEHLTLAEFCVNKQLIPEAIEEYKHIIKLPNCPIYVYKNLGQLSIKDKDPVAAASYYEKYLQLIKAEGKSDKEVEEKLAELNKLKGKSNKALANKNTDKGQAKDAHNEGLEGKTQWKAESWGSPSSITNQEIDGNKVLRIDFEGSDKDKTAIGYSTTIDTTNKSKLTFSVFSNDNDNMRLSIALVTQPGWAWYESKFLTIKPKWNIGMNLDITGTDFKSEETKWTFTTPIKHRNNVKKIFFIIYNGKKSGTLFIDDIHFK